MIFNMVGGGGAGGASIFIINSANERPTNVFNNTLWVNTDIDVVKYVFSDNEPSNPTEGMLWLTISDSDNINVAAPINKDWMKFNLGIVRQYISGAWERKLAQLYKDGIWVDVSRLFAAYIDITYPANSNCVVTNSIGQTVASNTNTTSSEKTFTAIVGATGTYTVTATATDDSGNSKSQSVSITAEGQSVKLELSYALVLFDGENGGDNTAVTGRWLTYAEYGSSVNVSAEKITMDGGEGYPAAVATKNVIDLSEYSTLFMRYKINSTRGSTSDILTFGVTASSDAIFSSEPSFTASKSLTIKTTSGVVVLSCDISSVGTGVVGVNAKYEYNIDIFEIWLE